MGLYVYHSKVIIKENLHCAPSKKKEEESSKQFFLTSFEKDVGFVDNFLVDIAVFRELLLEAFLKPLIDALAFYSLPTGRTYS